MYIACPKCDTKFVVTEEQIGHHGRKVKCSKCSNIWHQTLDNHVKVAPILTPIAVPATPLGNGINLPALLPIKIPAYLYTMPLLLVCMIIFMLVMLFPDRLGLESILDQEQVNIQDIHIDNQKDIEKIIVSYKVLNSSDKDINMPLVRIRLFDKNNRVLKSHIVDHTKIALSPRQYVHIKTEFVPAPPAAESIDIMIGNRLDFILR